jgi:hypothetical protein
MGNSFGLISFPDLGGAAAIHKCAKRIYRLMIEAM